METYHYKKVKNLLAAKHLDFDAVLFEGKAHYCSLRLEDMDGNWHSFILNDERAKELAYRMNSLDFAGVRQ